jgi:phosphoglycolate phosphatase
LNTIQLDAAIVDLDGTMVDTLGDFEVALNLMLSDLRLPQVSRAQLGPLVGKGSEHLIKSVLALVNASSNAINNEALEAHYPEAWASYQRHYSTVNGQFSQVYPGVVEGLRWLQGRHLRLACLTNKPTAFALPLLKAKGLDGFFERVFGGDAFERKKPDPLPLLKTCEALGSLPGRTLMLGDSSNDAQAARAAGCPVVLVSYGYNHGQPANEVDSDGLVDSLGDLALLRLSGRPRLP